MDTTVLLYGLSRDTHSALVCALRARGFRLFMTDNLTRLHQIVESRRVDALFIDGKTCPSGTPAETGLIWVQEFSMLTVILEPRDNRSGYAMLSGPPGRGSQEKKRKDRLLAGIKSIMDEAEGAQKTGDKGSISGDSYPARSPRIAQAEIPPLPLRFTALGLHRKMGGFLSLIEAAGSEGIDARELEAKIWPHPGRSRRKDAQIYVSKIRKRLDSLEPNRFSIIFDKGRYRLVEAGMAPAP